MLSSGWFEVYSLSNKQSCHFLLYFSTLLYWSIRSDSYLDCMTLLKFIWKNKKMCSIVLYLLCCILVIYIRRLYFMTKIHLKLTIFIFSDQYIANIIFHKSPLMNKDGKFTKSSYWIFLFLKRGRLRRLLFLSLSFTSNADKMGNGG